MNKRIADLLLLTTAILWGLGYIGTDILIAQGMSPFVLIASRFLIASILLTILFFKKIELTRYNIFATLIVGLFLFLGFMFQTFAIDITSTTNVSIITGLNIIFIPFILFIFFKRKILFKNIISVLLTIVGIYILTGGLNDINYGDILTVVCALFFGLHIVSIGYFSKRVEIYTLVIGQMLVTSFLSFMMIIAFQIDFSKEIMNVSPLVLLFVGLVPSALCFLFQNLGIKYTDESRAGIILATESLWGAFFAVILLGEVMTINIFLGALLMSIAVIVEELK